MQFQNIKHLNKEDGKIYGISNTLTMVNPYRCYFIAHYYNNVIRGNDLLNTGWDVIPDGITKLQYRLSTGHLITVPKFRAYLHLVECSESLNGSRVFHSVNIKGMGDKTVTNFKIILKQDFLSKFKIGDILISEEKNFIQSEFWKFGA